MTLSIISRSFPQRRIFSGRSDSYVIFDGVCQEDRAHLRWYPYPALKLEHVLCHVDVFYDSCLRSKTISYSDDARLQYQRLNENKDLISQRISGNPARSTSHLREISTISFQTNEVNISLQNRLLQEWSPEPASSAILSLRKRNSDLAVIAAAYESKAKRERAERIHAENNAGELRKLLELNLPGIYLPTDVAPVGGTIACEMKKNVSAPLAEFLVETARCDLDYDDVFEFLDGLLSSMK